MYSTDLNKLFAECEHRSFDVIVKTCVKGYYIHICVKDKTTNNPISIFKEYSPNLIRLTSKAMMASWNYAIMHNRQLASAN